VNPPDNDWPKNYFNYFTETEEHFQRARGTGLFLLSPLDWALIESWKNAGVPLEAVLRGIDGAFEKWRAKRTRTQMVNSLAFCAQAVMTEADLLAGVTRPPEAKAAPPPFPAEDLRQYLLANAAAVREQGFETIAASLAGLAASAEQHLENLEELEQRLLAMEEKIAAQLRSQQTEEQLYEARKELDSHLRPYRGKMSAPHLAMLEKQYLEQRLFARAKVPRLSVFYLGLR
jgi:hypothetical protein